MALRSSRLVRVAQECLDVSGEVPGLLEQEPVRRVGVDLHACLRDQASKQVGVVSRIIESLSPFATNTGIFRQLSRWSFA